MRRQWFAYAPAITIADGLASIRVTPVGAAAFIEVITLQVAAYPRFLARGKIDARVVIAVAIIIPLIIIARVVIIIATMLMMI